MSLELISTGVRLPLMLVSWKTISSHWSFSFLSYASSENQLLYPLQTKPKENSSGTKKTVLVQCARDERHSLKCALNNNFILFFPISHLSRCICCIFQILLWTPLARGTRSGSPTIPLAQTVTPKVSDYWIVGRSYTQYSLLLNESRESLILENYFFRHVE